MITKTPTIDWSEQFDVTEDDHDTLSEADVEEDTDFTDYLWMENEEEFDKDELQRLEEDDFMQQCLQEILIKEIGAVINEWQKEKAEDLEKALSTLAISDRNVENSSLNPLADEFIPMQNYFNIIIS